jgi:hypothetical protein
VISTQNSVGKQGLIDATVSENGAENAPVAMAFKFWNGGSAFARAALQHPVHIPPNGQFG